MQDEQISNWHQEKGMSKVVQHSCIGLVKAKLMQLPQVIVLDKFIPTTKWCPKCGKKNEMPLKKRIYECECGYQEDRDVHAARNMLEISHLVPTEYREVTLMEFKASALGSNAYEKAGTKK